MSWQIPLLYLAGRNALIKIVASSTNVDNMLILKLPSKTSVVINKVFKNFFGAIQ